MFNQPPNPLSRLLTPRVFFYVFLTLMLAWLMHRHSRHLQQAGQQAPERPESIPAYAPEPPPLKNSDLSAEPAQKKPMLILFGGPSDDLNPLREKLAPGFREECSILLLDTRRDASALEFFRIAKTPCALLFGTGNRELARKEEYITFESMREWLLEQLSARRDSSGTIP